MPHRRDHANIRLTHPSLYRCCMGLAVMDIALALNFFLTTPTFNPFGIPKNVVGVIFMTIGVAKVFFLNVYRSLRLTRLAMAINGGFLLSWGMSTSQSFFQHKSSLQLPVLYLSLAALQFFLLIEPYLQPITRRKPK